MPSSVCQVFQSRTKSESPIVDEVQASALFHARLVLQEVKQDLTQESSGVQGVKADIILK